MNDKQEIDKLFAVTPKGKAIAFDMPFTNSIVINEEEHHIEIGHDAHFGTYLLWNDNRYPVEVVRSKQNKYEILVNGIAYSFTIETPFSMHRIKVLGNKKEKSNQSIIKAPMPGKITDVLVHKGSKISRGDTLLILEAMKMQNDILSPVDGEIVSIWVEKNKNVMKDDILVELKIYGEQ